MHVPIIGKTRKGNMVNHILALKSSASLAKAKLHMHIEQSKEAELPNDHWNTGSFSLILYYFLLLYHAMNLSADIIVII